MWSRGGGHWARAGRLCSARTKYQQMHARLPRPAHFFERSVDAHSDPNACRAQGDAAHRLRGRHIPAPRAACPPTIGTATGRAPRLALRRRSLSRGTPKRRPNGHLVHLAHENNSVILTGVFTVLNEPYALIHRCPAKAPLVPRPRRVYEGTDLRMALGAKARRRSTAGRFNGQARTDMRKLTDRQR